MKNIKTNLLNTQRVIDPKFFTWFWNKRLDQDEEIAKKKKILDAIDCPTISEINALYNLKDKKYIKLLRNQEFFNKEFKFYKAICKLEK